jgi:amidase
LSTGQNSKFAVAADDVIALGGEWGIPMKTDEAAHYAVALNRLSKDLAQLDDMSPTNVPVSDERAGSVYLSDSSNDPSHFFIWRCDIRCSDTGTLAGLTVGLKDNISLAGVPMTLGSRFLESYVPNTNATVAARLLDAGARIIGKLNMDSFSHAAQSFGGGLGDFVPPLNPVDPGRMTGGSSSGAAAAVAAGEVDLAIGGDQGGSIRIPSSWCGVVGLKPTHGLIPHTGAIGIEPTLDHLGPIAQSVDLISIALGTLAGGDGCDPRQAAIPRIDFGQPPVVDKVDGLRIGLLREGFGSDDSDADVDRIVSNAVGWLSARGAEIQEVSVPGHIACQLLARAMVFLGQYMFFQYFESPFVQSYHQSAFTTAFADFIKTRPGLLPPRVKLSLLLGSADRQRAITRYNEALRLGPIYTAMYDAAFEEVDCLVMPTVPITAPIYIPPADPDVALERTLMRGHLPNITRNTAPFNVTGHPALTVPCGDSGGLPVGIMLVGKHFSEPMLFRIAKAVESGRDKQSSTAG